MAIQISGTTVIDNSRNLTNTVNITASGTIAGGIIATKAVAEAGTNNTKLMTPLRVKEAIAALGGNVINRIQRGSTAYNGNSVTAPITAVNLNKSMISNGNRGNHTTALSGHPSAPAVTAYGTASARITSSTQVTVTAGTNLFFPYPVFNQPQGFSSIVPNPLPNTGTVDWEVIEFK